MYPIDNVSLAPHPLNPTGAPEIAFNTILTNYWAQTFTEDIGKCKRLAWLSDLAIAKELCLPMEHFQNKVLTMALLCPRMSPNISAEATLLRCLGPIT